MLKMPTIFRIRGGKVETAVPPVLKGADWRDPISDDMLYTSAFSQVLTMYVHEDHRAYATALWNLYVGQIEANRDQREELNGSAIRAMVEAIQ